MTKRFMVSVGVFFGAALIFVVAMRPAVPEQPTAVVSPTPPSATSAGQATTTPVSSTTPASLDTTTQNVSSNPQCANGESLITIPTSSEFTVDETPFCTELNVGPAFVSPDRQWTAAIESIPGTDMEGRLTYQLPYGPGLWEADRNIFVLLTNRVTGKQKEIGVGRAVLEGDVVAFAEGQERIESNIVGWSANGKELWGWAAFSTNSDTGIGDFSAQSLRASFFKIDTATWKSDSFSVRLPIDHLEVAVNSKLSSVLNTDRGMALYGEIIGSSTLSLDIYDLSTRTTTTVASFPGDFIALGCDPNSTSAPLCQTETYKLSAHWINSSTISWLDPRSGVAVTTKL